MNWSIQAIGGALAVVAWWYYGTLHPGSNVPDEVVAATVVLWQMVAGVAGFLVARAMAKVVGRDVVNVEDETLPPKKEGGFVAPRMLAIIAALALLAGCASSQFETLLNDVKANCHTTIDAQVSATLAGLGGAGHFQQECWPEGTAPMTASRPVNP